MATLLPELEKDPEVIKRQAEYSAHGASSGTIIGSIAAAAIAGPIGWMAILAPVIGQMAGAALASNLFDATSAGRKLTEEVINSLLEYVSLTPKNTDSKN